MSDFAGELQRLSGTSLDPAGAANSWAGTTDLELVHALNVKAGITDPRLMLELNGVCQLLAQTTTFDAAGAFQGMVSGVGAAVNDLLLESGFHILLDQGGGIVLNEPSRMLLESDEAVLAENGNRLILELL